MTSADRQTVKNDVQGWQEQSTSKGVGAGKQHTASNDLSAMWIQDADGDGKDRFSQSMLTQGHRAAAIRRMMGVCLYKYCRGCG